MPMTGRRALLRGVIALLAGGCMSNARRLDTPASKLDTFALRHKEPNERFYALVWSSQRVIRRPAYTHTFLTVVRAVDRPGQEPALDHHTISWLPATLEIRPLDFRVEPGVNLGLRETLDLAQRTRQRVSLWGPYETHASFYRRFLVQKGFMETSGVGYQCADSVGEAPRTGRGCCCIHAITDMDPTYDRTSFPLVWHGDSASEHLANRMHKGTTLIDPGADHSWLIGALGLDANPIRRRHYGDRVLEFPRVPRGSRSAPLPPRPASDAAAR
ncbi:MAG: hypothetical protein K2W96_01665 [Gemmataceae bacterium]|nr:hypothetical protein [Gemmataceae bacterium]